MIRLPYRSVSTVGAALPSAINKFRNVAAAVKGSIFTSGITATEPDAPVPSEKDFTHSDT